eukprot:4677921-Pleurochrysis_carterae.AAC.1
MSRLRSRRRFLRVMGSCSDRASARQRRQCVARAQVWERPERSANQSPLAEREGTQTRGAVGRQWHERS